MKNTAIIDILFVFFYLVTTSQLHAEIPVKGPVRVSTNQVIVLDLYHKDLD